uniref:SAM domain-containing protein n=1 Tax=Clastoptera arizonana TaxID=38151 RepID=A0A1B6DIK3_9HEMI
MSGKDYCFEEAIIQLLSNEKRKCCSETLKSTNDLKLLVSEIIKTDSDSLTNVFHFAAANGFIDECKILIAKKLDINEKNTMGWTPLMQAIRNGHFDIVEMMIQSGGDVNLSNGYGINGISLAVLNNNLDILNLVLNASKNEDTANQNLFLALELSCLHGFIDIIEFIVSFTVLNLNNLSPLSDLSPLMLAVTGGHKNVVQFLLEHGAEPLLQNKSNRTALDLALYTNNLSIKSLLCIKSPSESSQSFLKSPFQTSYYPFPSFDNLSRVVLPNHLTKQHIPLVPLSPFPQTQQFVFNLSPCCCKNAPSCHKLSPNVLSNEVDARASSFDSFDRCSDIAALVSPRIMKNYCKRHAQTSPNESHSPVKGKKRKLFDKHWCSSWMKKISKRLPKVLDNNDENINDISKKKSKYNDFTQLLIDLGLEHYLPIFKEHELDIGVFLTLSTDDLEIMGIKDKHSQTIILNQIENLKRTQL